MIVSNETLAVILMSYSIYDRLKKCPVFSSCADSLLADIEKNYLHVRRAEKGGILISGDNFIPGLYIILSGRAVVFKSNTSDVFMSVIEEGGAFGMASMFSSSDSQFPTEITALTDCETAVIYESDFEMLLRDNANIAVNYIKLLTDKIRFLNLKIDTYTSPSVNKKLAFYLFCNTDSAGRAAIPEQGMTALAKQLNTGRASLYRAFDYLEDMNLIKRDGKIISVYDKEKLKNIQE